MESERWRMMNDWTLAFLKQMAAGIAGQFGENCEVVVHRFDGSDPEHTIVAVENGHVTGRALGDGPSRAVLAAMHSKSKRLKDHINYLTQTKEGRVLKSSTLHLYDETGKIMGLFAINYDITEFMMAERAIKQLTKPQVEDGEPDKIVQNVKDLLNDLIDQSVELVGKPVAAMTKEDKIHAIQFLNNAGAFLITKSSEKVSKFFGISKYTLYNYIDAKA